MRGRRLWGWFAVAVVAVAACSSDTPDESDGDASEDSPTSAPVEASDDLAGKPADDLPPFSPLVAVGGSLVAYRAVDDGVLRTVVVDAIDRTVQWSLDEPVDRITGVPMPPPTYLADSELMVVLTRDRDASPPVEALRGTLTGADPLAIQGRDPATGAIRWSVEVTGGSPSDFPAPCEDGAAACLLVENDDATTDLFVYAGPDGAAR